MFRENGKKARSRIGRIESVLTLFFMCSGLLLVAVFPAQVSAADEGVVTQQQRPPYEPVTDAIGDIELAVTDATLVLAERMTDALQRHQPGLRVNLRTLSLTVSESWWRTTPASEAALFFTPMSELEKGRYLRTNGHAPAELPIATDAIAIVVNRNNPIAGRALAVTDLDRIYSETPRHGRSSLRSWGQLGLQKDWHDRPLEPLAQDHTMAVAGHFRRLVLGGRDIRSDIPRLMSSARVLQRVSETPYAMGYVPRSRLDQRVATVAVSGGSETEDPISTPGSTSDLQEPLGYRLHLYLDHEPGQPLPATTGALLRFLYSREGQQVISRMGYAPVGPSTASDELMRFEME